MRRARRHERTCGQTAGARKLQVWLRALSLAWGVILFSALGCDEPFEPASKINTLRVMGVRADNPYPMPGESVSLEMLWHDGKAPPDDPRPVQIVWISGCFNPDADLYYGCFEQLGKLFQEASLSEASEFIGIGDTFDLDIPPDIISRRPTSQGLTPYGLSYVFFGVCAGSLAPVEPGEDGLPLGCLDPNGNRLGADDFVPGFFSLYSYESITNANPMVTGFTVGGEQVDEGDEPHFARQELEVKVFVDPASVELNPLALDINENQLMEQMWVAYFTTGGSLEKENRLVNDATKGFNEDTGVKLSPPAEPGKVYVFAVVHDSRGGVTWVKRGIWFD